MSKGLARREGVARALEVVVNVAVVLSLPLIVLGLWRAGGGVLETVAEGRQEKGRIALVDSVLREPNELATYLGGAAAQVVAVAVVDYECPSCRLADSLLAPTFVKGAQQRLLVLQFPLGGIHSRAGTAARGAICAGAQGRFQELHHAMFREGAPDTDMRMSALAIQAGIADVASFMVCLRSPATTFRLEHEVAVARRLGVSGTPTFVLPGGRMGGIQEVVALLKSRDSG